MTVYTLVYWALLPTRDLIRSRWVSYALFWSDSCPWHATAQVQPLYTIEWRASELAE
jgi:hypothetical protein